MSKPTPTPKRFDPAILESMAEPLFVRVERRAGGASTPIDLPPEEGMPTGYSKERIKSLESWLVNEWSGGGIYFFIVSDSSQEPKKMEWLTTYDPRTFPPRQPPTMAASAFTPMAPMMAQPAPQAFQQPPAPQVSMSSSPWPSGFQYNQPPVGAAQPAPQPQFYPPPQFIMQQPQQQVPFTPFQQPDRAAQAEKERLEREKAELASRLAASEKREAEEKHQRELERIRQDSDRKLDELKASLAPKSDPSIDARFAKLENVLEKLVDRITATPAPTGPSPEMLALQRQVEQAARDREEMQREMQRRDEKAELERRADRERQERERSEAALRDEMRRQEAGFKDMIANMTAMIAKLESKPTGPDPLIQFMQESNRNQLDATRDMMRQQQTALDNLRQMMMTPRDVLALAKEGQGGFDEIRRQLTGTYGDVMGAYRQVLETAMQMQPQGESPAFAMAKDAIGQAKEFAERYFGGKSKENIELMRAQRAVAEAQARAAGAAAAAAAGAGVNADLAHQAAQEAAAGGLSGAVITPPPVFVPDKNATTPGGALPSPSNVIPITQAVVQNAQGTVTSPKRSDQDWFGVALGEVARLREAVAVYLDAIQQGEAGIDPKTKRPRGASAEQAVSAILQAAAVIATQRIPVPAFTELFMQERVADFIDVLLPAPVPQAYRDDVVQIIYAQLKAQAEEEEDDDDEDDDEDEDEQPGAVS